MPVGKISSPEGPNAQATLGTVLDSNEKSHFILNNANLKKDEPVLFDVRAFDLDIDGQNVKIKIAVLELDDEGIPVIRKKIWPKLFKAKWDREWEKVGDEQIKKMKMKIKGKFFDKKQILELKKENQVSNSKI